MPSGRPPEEEQHSELVKKQKPASVQPGQTSSGGANTGSRRHYLVPDVKNYHVAMNSAAFIPRLEHPAVKTSVTPLFFRLREHHCVSPAVPLPHTELIRPKAEAEGHDAGGRANSHDKATCKTCRDEAEGEWAVRMAEVGQEREGSVPPSEGSVGDVYVSDYGSESEAENRVEHILWW
ncbi:hypothetical protein BD311DRAFT_739061 [Dichomitus squalens]|uniref:Uncharacterized protein n=1 Tax=Dichomitus squalens TaxID=114155 RepID=A0A4Q9MPA6_9APHY|nr:hypothetical protein BD311DRAFT_739061 [Dichomitus squalens]